MGGARDCILEKNFNGVNLTCNWGYFELGVAVIWNWGFAIMNRDDGDMAWILHVCFEWRVKARYVLWSAAQIFRIQSMCIEVIQWYRVHQVYLVP